MISSPLPPAEFQLLRAISRYDGADETRSDKPEHAMALDLEDRGLIKVVAVGVYARDVEVAIWKLTQVGLDVLAAA